MERDDEKRQVNDIDESPANSQSGDILGLSGSVVPKMPGDPSASSDPESVRRRRERLREGEESSTQSGGDAKGATGIDMGAGGQGTDISGS